MKQSLFIFVLLSFLFSACGKNFYQSNGESIYKSGRNLRGERLLDKQASSIRLIRSCITCHGPQGDRLHHLSVQFSWLSAPGNLAVPYTDSLFFRFLDQDLRSDGHKANIGVIWKMSDEDKGDLLAYLKGL